MLLRLSLICFIAIFSLCTASAQSADAVTAWQNYMTPSAAHKILQQFDGEWAEEVSMWMQPNAAPQKFTIACTNKMIMGGRYQKSMHKGELAGMPYEAEGLLSYNNASKKFLYTFFNNMGTGVLVMQGDWLEKDKSINLTGELPDPSGKSVIQVRQKITFLNPDTILIESFDKLGNAPESKSVEYRFTRKKS